MSLDLYETLGYEGVLVSPELVDDVLPIAQDEGKVPEEMLEVCCTIELSEQLLD